MPIEIKELIIRTTVKTTSKGATHATPVSAEEMEILKEQIKKECLDWLLEHLESKKMR